MYLFIIIILLVSLFQMLLNHEQFLLIKSAFCSQEDVSILPASRENTISVAGNVLTLHLPQKTTGKYASSAHMCVWTHGCW